MKASSSEPDHPDVSEHSFEESLAELQQIVGRLEAGTLPLEQSMQQFERGIALLRSCQKVLDAAGQRIEILTGLDASGQPVTVPFDATATFDAAASSAQDSETAKPAAAPAKKARARRSTLLDDGDLPF
jgi:exodeoxyribonuclease VII small subunit